MHSDLPQLETTRLRLRPPALADFERWAELAADAEATRFIGGLQPRAVAWRSFAAMVGMWRLTGIAMFSVIEKDSGRWVGRLGPWRPEGWPGTEVGWSLHRDAWGKAGRTPGEECLSLNMHGFVGETAPSAMDKAGIRLS